MVFTAELIYQRSHKKISVSKNKFSYLTFVIFPIFFENANSAVNWVLVIC